MNRPFRFGVVASHAPSHTAWISTARRVEELGYATLLVVDRMGAGLAPFTALAVAAEATTSLRVGTFVFCNDFRHPAVLAKEAATLDLLSEGRFELGLGAGVGPSDYNQMGIPFESAGTRVSRLEESLQIIKQLFTEEIVNFSGKYYTINRVERCAQASPAASSAHFTWQFGQTDALDCCQASRHHYHHAQLGRPGGRCGAQGHPAKDRVGATKRGRALRSSAILSNDLQYQHH